MNKNPLTIDELKEMKEMILDQMAALDNIKDIPKEMLIPKQYRNEYADECLKLTIRQNEVTAFNIIKLVNENKTRINPEALSESYHSILGNVIINRLREKYKF